MGLIPGVLVVVAIMSVGGAALLLCRSRNAFIAMVEASPLASALVRIADRTLVASNTAFDAGPRIMDEHVGAALDLLERDGYVKNLEVKVGREEGAVRTLLLSAQRVETAGRAYAMMVFDDITDRLATEDCFRKAFYSSPLPQTMIRVEDRALVAVNDAFLRTFGYSRDELIGRTTDTIASYADPRDREQMIATLRAEGRVTDASVRLLTKTGEMRDVVWSISFVVNDGHSTLLTTMRDVTESRRAAATLAASEARFATAFRSNPLPAAILRASDQTIVDINDAFVTLFGFGHDELVGNKPHELLVGADPEARATAFGIVASTGRLREHEITIRVKSGRVCEALVSIEPFDLDHERALLVVIQDITQRKLLERQQRESAMHFAAAFMNNPLASTIVRVSDHTFVAINNAFTQLFGYEKDEVIGRSTDDFTFYANSGSQGQAYARSETTGALHDQELRLLTKAGQPVDVLCSGELIEIAGEPHLIGIFNDITARKAAEQALRESEQRFRDLADNTQEVFWISTPGLEHIQYISPAYERVWGRSCASLYADARTWLEAIVPEDRERVLASTRNREYAEKYRIRRPDGQVRWIFDRGTTICDDSGRVVRRVGVAKDMSAHVQLEEQLRQTQKLESLGLLAGGVAHDFNNVLAVIASCASLLGDGTSSPAEVQELVADIDHAVQRASGLTRQLLAFSRKQVTEPKVIDVNSAVNETRKMLRRMLGEDILLSTSLHPDIGCVRIDPGHFVQILMNLAVNARDAMPRGGNLSITTREAPAGACEDRGTPSGRMGDAIVLTVEDTGAGMPAEILERIFEPFFTTKGVGKGTGMGLAVVHGIVDQAGGSIAVESTPGVGTRFRIYLPTVAAAVDSFEAIHTAMAAGKETILLVDDDDHVRRAAARALRARGFTVIEAADGLTALVHLDERAAIDLLLTDVVMPGMDGRQLAEAARLRSPALKVLYTSGYTDDAVVRHGVLHGEVELLEKPFRLDTLASKVRAVLDC